MAQRVGIIEAVTSLAVAAQEPQPGRGVLVVLLLIGLVAVAAGLRLFLGNRTGDDDAAGHDVPDARSPAASRNLPPAVDPTPPTAALVCDWMLAIDTDAGDPVTIRPAQGRVCCIHTVRLTSTEPLGRGPIVEEHLAWSGDRTRVTGNLVASTTEQDLITHQRTPRQLGLVATAALARRPGPMVTTPWTAVPEGQPASDPEHLWKAHLDTLRERRARTRGGQEVSVHQVDANDRCDVSIDVHRGCDHGHHIMHAEASVHVRISASAHGADTARVVVGGSPFWMAGDLTLTPATTMSTVGEVAVTGTDGGVPHVAIDPVDDPATIVLVGQADTTIEDDGLAVAMGSDLATELTLGPPVDDAAELRVEIRSEPALRIRVEAVAPDTSRDLGCDCVPTYELRFGELPSGPSASSPAAQLDVQGQRFQIVRTRGIRLDGTPEWTVQDAGHAKSRGTRDDTAGQADDGTADSGGGAGAGDIGQRDAGATDPRPAGRS
jgi:hypothetical protein